MFRIHMPLYSILILNCSSPPQQLIKLKNGIGLYSRIDMCMVQKRDSDRCRPKGYQKFESGQGRK